MRILVTAVFSVSVMFSVLPNVALALTDEEKVALAKAVALILKAFYDEDIVNENVLISWYDGPKSEFSPPSVNDEALALVKEKAAVFINWMKDASSDDSDDSDDSEDSEDSD